MPERTVAIVGRPNVGKSALFNRLIGRKVSIVHDMPGVTRDRIAAKCKLGREPFTVVDTGGIGSDVDTSFTEQVRAEVDIALATSDLLIFVVDGQQGLSPIDLELARQLRKIDKPLILAVNKIDHESTAPIQWNSRGLGLRRRWRSAQSTTAGLANWWSGSPPSYPPAEQLTEAEQAAAQMVPVAVAIVGRPNVGKSSLTNAILQDDRTLVSEISGTTRDAIDVPYERHGNRYT
jgi:GTP-binding protein